MLKPFVFYGVLLFLFTFCTHNVSLLCIFNIFFCLLSMIFYLFFKNTNWYSHIQYFPKKILIKVSHINVPANASPSKPTKILLQTNAIKARITHRTIITKIKMPNAVCSRLAFGLFISLCNAFVNLKILNIFKKISIFSF